jgi:hypothetical protein
VPAGQSVNSIVPDSLIFRYPQFVTGKVYFKDGLSFTANLNYNALLGEVQFINEKSDTLSLADENSVKFIIIGKDSFYYSNGYIELITGNDRVKLGVSQKLVVTDKSKIGAYNQPTARSSITSYSSVAIGNQRSALSVREEMVLTNQKTFLIGDKFNKFNRLNKKDLLKRFSSHSQEIENFLRENKIDFNRKEDAIRLIRFLQEIV